MLTTSHHTPHATESDAVVLRLARESDTLALRRLAALDSSEPLAGEALIAEQGGEPRAAISLHSGRAIADPFRRTNDLVTLLRARAELLHGAEHPAERRRSPFRRTARAA